MKTSLIKSILFSMVLLITCSSCERWLQKHYSLHIKNNSYFDTYCYFYLAWQGGPDGVVYPDTLLYFDKSELVFIKNGDYFRTSRSASPIIDWVASLPKDTLSIFYFQADTINKYSWEEIRHDYKVLCRYDLSSEDIRLLYDKYGIPEIPYPPTAAMKNMKMYPPYGSSK